MTFYAREEDKIITLVDDEATEYENGYITTDLEDICDTITIAFLDGGVACWKLSEKVRLESLLKQFKKEYISKIFLGITKGTTHILVALRKGDKWELL